MQEVSKGDQYSAKTESVLEQEEDLDTRPTSFPDMFVLVREGGELFSLSRSGMISSCFLG